MPRKRDFIVRKGGTVVQIMATTEKARKWLKDNTNSEPWQWLGNCLCVDHRFAPDLIQGIQEAGFAL